MIINRIDVDKFRDTVEKAKKDPISGRKTMAIEGEWLIGRTGPQFEAKIKTETGGEFILQSDETQILGGGGSAPNPVQYCIYGSIACYAATFAKWAAMEGIALKSLKIKAEATMDLTRSFGIGKNPIMSSLKWDIIVDSDAGIEKLNKLNEIAKERCPAYYCLTHQIFPEIKITKNEK